MNFHFPIFNDEPGGRNSQASLPPSYNESTRSPLLVAEMTTTRTEVVTTETTTHLFSLPTWKKRSGPRSPVLPQGTEDATNSFDMHHSRKPPPSPALYDKALPPTPPNELPDPIGSTSDDLEQSMSSAVSSISQLDSYRLRSRKSSAGPHATVALVHAALGVGLPHASTSMSRETNGISFMTPSSPVSSGIASSPSVRRVKSSQRVQQRHASDTHENAAHEKIIERRKRGLSFTTASFLHLGNTDVKGKGKEVQQQSASPKVPPPPLSRKSSFWSKKKTNQPSESPQTEATLTLPSIPPVDQFTPFEISSFTIPSSTSSITSSLPHASDMSRSLSENAGVSHSSSSSPRILPPGSISFPRTSQSHGSTNERTAAHTSDSVATPRLRTQTTPLLHRLSMGVFSSGELSPAPSTRPHDQTQSASPSPHPFPRKPDMPIPKPRRSEESPEVYLTRLKSAVGKAEVAGILASSSDPFYSEALRAYIKQFEFHDIPLDVALRKLLMEVGLPRETQQIDRVMEAFASRYMFCNPRIFTSEDHPYILAFSLIMLHTDAFNPSNKRKMTKADYIKNTKLPGISTEVLNCFFDNIVFAPFIFIEDPLDFSGQSGLPDVMQTLAVNSPTSALSNSNTPGSFKIGNKVDPYYLITNDLLEPLRIDINSRVPLENPFTYEGTSGPWDEQELHEAFVKANTIHIEVPSVQRTPTMFGLHSGTTSVFNDIESADDSRPVETWSLKVTKVGLLNRKDDILEGGKRSSNRKWRTWSVILTGSQLLFFRDPTWATSLLRSSESPSDEQMAPIPTVNFRPDESFSVKDAIAVYDRSYTKYKHALRFVLPDGRQSLLQAADDADLDSWISRINYASAFKSAGVRMRPPGLSGEDVLLTGVAAATSHLHDLQQHSELRRHRSWDSNVAHELLNMLSSPNDNRRPLRRRITMSGRADFEIDAPIAPEVDGAEQFKATFDQVKADLAASSWSSLDDPWLSQEEDSDINVYDSPPTSPGSSPRNSSELPSRSQIIQSKIRDIDSRIQASQAQYDADMRYIHNIAILTPFQKSTRSRLSAAIQGVAKRVSLVRLDREKLKCHRHVLICDLASEGRSWSQSKQIALRAAKQTLQSRRSQNLPTMALSLSNNSAADFSHLPHTPLSQRPESSNCDSFHSAADFGVDWTSSEDSTFLSAKSDSQKSPSPASTSCPRPQDTRPSLSKSFNSNSHRPASSQGDSTLHDTANLDNDPDHVEEEAEEWNRTRCAQRVSLIHVPSSIMLSPRVRASVSPK